MAYEKNPDELGVLWQKQSSAGNTFLSGTGVKIDPDFELLLMCLWIDPNRKS